ncbi:MULTISPECIES: hypothetical protein [unclassified Nocardiopsis]|uniref:hypothetical protein n=1 Tax=Nocardiopsis TaxID=2013 RepID=UPI00387AF9C2
MSSKHYGIEQARKILGDLVLEVQRTGQPITLTRGNSRTPIARIAPLENTMPDQTNVNDSEKAVAAADARKRYENNVTTEYGEWGSYGVVTGRTTHVEDYVRNAIAGQVEVDIDDVTTDFREALNEQLPEGVTLNGRIFYGPVEGRPEWNADVLAAAIDAVDFWAIVAEHDNT